MYEETIAAYDEAQNPSAGSGLDELSDQDNSDDDGTPDDPTPTDAHIRLRSPAERSLLRGQLSIFVVESFHKGDPAFVDFVPRLEAFIQSSLGFPVSDCAEEVSEPSLIHTSVLLVLRDFCF